MSKEVGRETMLNASPMSKTGLVLAQLSDGSSPDTPLLHGQTCENHTFQIGERCYVGGTRPGIVAYVGETHFAPGEWVGIVLEEPSGKNDGCVSGKRYFQCEPKRGVFSRANRLTLTPVVSTRNSLDSDNLDFTKIRRSVSPTPSVSSGIKTMSSRLREFLVGDRVIVSSGFGSRPGELKFIGETKFAAGNWCGVQLDEPNGKNDGSVDGVKYFDCPLNYGIFVPIAKVSFSPGARKSLLSRAGSKESLTSLATLNSVATTNTSRLRMSRLKKPTASSLAMSIPNSTKLPPKSSFSMQDLIREKQQHIEQLIKERDLDKEDSQNQILFFQKTLSELNDKIVALDIKLNESERKNEELQNAVDEATFCGNELAIQNQEWKEKIEALQNTLTQNGIQFEPSVNPNFTSTCQKCQELENEIAKLKDSDQMFKNDLDTSGFGASKPIIDSNIIAKEEELYSKELKISELENQIIGLKHDKEILKFDFQDNKLQMESLEVRKNEELHHIQSKLNEMQIINANLIKDSQINLEKKCLLEKQLLEIQKEVNTKEVEIKKIINEQDDKNEEFSKCKSEMENLKDEISRKEIALKEYQEKCITLNDSLIEIRRQKEKFEKEMQNIKEQITEESKNFLDIEKELRETVEKLNNEKEVLIKKQEESLTGSHEFALKLDNLQVSLKENEIKYATLQKDHDHLKVEKAELIDFNNKTKEILSEKLKILNQNSQEVILLKDSLEKYKLENIELSKLGDETRNILNETTFSRDKEISELTEKLSNSILENKNLKETVDNFNQVNKNIREELKAYEEKINDTKSELSSNIQIKESCLKELKSLTDQYESLRKEIGQKNLTLQEYENKILNMEKQRNENEQIKEDLEKNIIIIKEKQFESESILTKQLNEIKFSNEKLVAHLDALKKEISEKACEIKVKDNSLEELQKQLKNLEFEFTSSLKNKESGDNELNKISMALDIVKDDAKQKQLKLNEKEKKIIELETQIQNTKIQKEHLEEELHTMKGSLDSSNAAVKEKESQIIDLKNENKLMQNQCENVKVEKNQIEDSLKESKKAVVDLQIEKETLENVLKNLQNMQQELEKINKDKEENISKKEFELSERSKIIHNLETENSRLISNFDQLNKNFEQLSTDFNEQKVDLENNKSFNERGVKSLKEKDKLLNEMENKFKNIQTVLSTVTQEKLNLSQQLKDSNETKEMLNKKITEIEENCKLINDKLSLSENSCEINLKKLHEITVELEITSGKLKKEENLSQEATKNFSNLNKQYLELIEEKKSIDLSFQLLQEKFSNFEIAKEREISELSIKLEEILKESSNSGKNFNVQINELKEKCAALEESLATQQRQQNDFSKLKESYLEDIASKVEEIKNYEEKIIELQQTNLIIKEEKLQLEEKYLIEQNHKIGTDDECDRLKIELSNEKQNYQMLNNKYEKLIMDISTLENSCKILNELEQKTLDLQHINDMLLEENNKLKQDVEKIEKEKQDAINNAELLEFENDKELEKLKQVTINIQTEIQNCQKQLKLKEKELTEMSQLYEMSRKKLLEQVNQGNLEKEIQNLKSSIAKTEFISNNPSDEISSNVIESDDAARQINFLNSIIADMQEKNETLKARINVLEMNPVDISKHFNLDFLKKKPAPRLFCDICEEFDKHDTEDCPLQSSDSPPISTSTSSNLISHDSNEAKRIKPPPREYCENCEIFGHDTNACPNECF